MAPEQRDHPALVDHRADIFSLGVVLYEMLTGELPGAKLQPPSRRVEIDVRLDEIVLRALEQQPELRFQTASDFRTQVTTFVKGEAIHAGKDGRDQSPRIRLTDANQPKRGDWTLWSPSQSPRVAEICSHMTREERIHARWMGALFGLWNAATFFLPFFVVMFMPKPLGWILGGLTFVTGLAFYPLLLRMQREALLNTTWARQQKITPDQIRRRKWTSIEITVVAGGVAGIGGLIFMTVIGWNRVYAVEQAPTASLLGVLIAGVISVVVVWMKLRRRETAPDDSKTHSRLSTLVLVVGFVVLGTGTFKLLMVLRLANSESATVFIQPSVEGGHFSLQHAVESSTGWNVWVTLENVQLFDADDPANESGEPVIVSRYQAKLTGSGRVRIPLEYLPASEEGRDKMLDTIGPVKGWKFFLSPKHDVSLLAYSTESLMRVWAIATILPEGLTPDSLLVNEPIGSPRYKTIESPAQSTPVPLGGPQQHRHGEPLTMGDEPANDQQPRKPNEEAPNNKETIDSQSIIKKLDENEQYVRGFRVKTETRIRQRVGENLALPEIDREITTSFAIDERGQIRSEQTGGVPGQIGTTEVRQQHVVAVFDGLILRLLEGSVNEPGNWGYQGRNKYRMPREVDPRNYLLEHNNEPLRQQFSGGTYEAVGKEQFQGRNVIAFESAITTRESEKTSYRGRILIDPDLGYAAVYRVSQIRFDDQGTEWHDFARHELSDYKQSTGGIWVPGHAIYISLLPNRDALKANQPIETASQHDIRFLDWELNPQFTDEEFTLTFPDGIFVMDETKMQETPNP